MCENAKALEHGRTSYSFKTSLGVHTVSPSNFAIEAKNIILIALRTFEFSHSLDPKLTLLPQKPKPPIDGPRGRLSKYGDAAGAPLCQTRTMSAGGWLQFANALIEN